eukprot:SAG11_NODE_86_length_17300_cov_11.466717_2_plen_41_part_00
MLPPRLTAHAKYGWLFSEAPISAKQQWLCLGEQPHRPARL